MPVYEYQCRKCSRTTTFIEKVDEFKFFSRKCSSCGSRRMKRVLSNFSTKKNESTADMVNELKRYGKVNFVPKSSGSSSLQGPPPGGCPYASDSQKNTGKKED